ncbi:hypothetical protein J3R83DRAFT_4910, partial [Lanmaoa asiatica]
KAGCIIRFCGAPNRRLTLFRHISAPGLRVTSLDIHTEYGAYSRWFYGSCMGVLTVVIRWVLLQLTRLKKVATRIDHATQRSRD